MFGLQRGMFDRLVGQGFKKSWAVELANGLGNLLQRLQHEGPVAILVNQQDNALHLANYVGHGPAGEVSGNALYVSYGHGVTGNPALEARVEGEQVPPDTYHTYWAGLFDNYQEFNYPVTCNDDLRLNDVIKYGLPARGSTTLRVEFLTSFSGRPGSVAKARLIDENLQPIVGPKPKDGGGNPVAGWGVFDVKDVVGMAGAAGSNCNSSGGGYGYVIYMSDRANGGVDADNGTRKDLGMFELLSYTPKSPPASNVSVEVVTDVDLANCELTVCKRTLNFCQPVNIGPEDCG